MIKTIAIAGIIAMGIAACGGADQTPAENMTFAERLEAVENGDITLEEAQDARGIDPAPAWPEPEPEPTEKVWEDGTAETDAEKSFVSAYRAASYLDTETPDEAILATAGQVCVALDNRPADDVRRDLVTVKGLSDGQAGGLIEAASPERCAALGW